MANPLATRREYHWQSYDRDDIYWYAIAVDEIGRVVETTEVSTQVKWLKDGDPHADKWHETLRGLGSPVAKLFRAAHRNPELRYPL